MNKYFGVLLVMLLTLGFNHTADAQDWPNLHRYQESNTQIAAAHSGNRVIFMGDSITDLWDDRDSSFFKDNPYIDRGISGQTTPQMLIRFRADVIHLNPEAVVILAGTNDIAGNTGPSTLGMIEDNLASMSEIAEANGINVILCSVLPAYQFPWSKDVEPADKIVALNKWIREYAEENGYTYCNYYPALVNDRGGMQDKYSKDGVHPNKAGYDVMEPIVMKAINKALSK